MGQVLIGETWNLAIYGKGLQHQVFLDNGPSISNSLGLISKFLAFYFAGMNYSSKVVPKTEQREAFGSSLKRQ